MTRFKVISRRSRPAPAYVRTFAKRHSSRRHQQQSDRRRGKVSDSLTERRFLIFVDEGHHGRAVKDALSSRGADCVHLITTGRSPRVVRGTLGVMDYVSETVMDSRDAAKTLLMKYDCLILPHFERKNIGLNDFLGVRNFITTALRFAESDRIVVGVLGEGMQMLDFANHSMGGDLEGSSDDCFMYPSGSPEGVRSITKKAFRPPRRFSKKRAKKRTFVVSRNVYAVYYGKGSGRKTRLEQLINDIAKQFQR